MDIIIIAVVICVAAAIVYFKVISPKISYNNAFNLIESGKYDEGYALLEELGQNEAIKENKYERALSYIDNKDYKNAYLLLDGLNYKDSKDKANESMK